MRSSQLLPDLHHATIRFLNPSHITMAGRLSARYSGNLSYLKGIYETRKEWMLEPFENYGTRMGVGAITK